jgi:hypothetical protein
VTGTDSTASNPRECPQSAGFFVSDPRVVTVELKVRKLDPHWEPRRPSIPVIVRISESIPESPDQRLLSTYGGAFARGQLESVPGFEVARRRLRQSGISVDTVCHLAKSYHLPSRGVESFRKRLHKLHWMAHRDAGLEVPLLRRIEREKGARNSALSDVDPVVFWAVTDAFLGDELSTSVRRRPWDVIEQLACDLTSCSLWEKYLEMYEVAVDTVNEKRDELNEHTVSRELRRAFSSPFRALWPRRSSLGWLAAICSALSLGDDIIAVSGAGIGIADTVKKNLRALFKELGTGRSAIRARILDLIDGKR